MNILLWVIQGVLALVFLVAGVLKLVRTKEQLRPMMGWVESMPTPLLRVLGAVEVIGAAGVILPALLHIAVILTPLAAAGLLLIMVGAVATHLRLREPGRASMPVILGILAAVVAVLRFGPYHF